MKLAEITRKSFPCLNNNSVDNVSCVALSNAIANKRALSYLDLSDNLIGNRGATFLCYKSYILVLIVSETSHTKISAEINIQPPQKGKGHDGLSYTIIIQTRLHLR